MIRDDDQEQAEYALDLRMFFNVSSALVDGEAGGQTVYIARGEDEELVTVMPEENTLSLVYRYVVTGKQGNKCCIDLDEDGPSVKLKGTPKCVDVQNWSMFHMLQTFKG